MRKFLGFQVANEFGENIQGDSDEAMHHLKYFRHP